MKYFLHDTSAFQDEKITELFINFGYEGIGLFYTILEKLALQEKPVKTDVLKKQLFVRKKLEKCWKFMEEIDLISSNNHETFNKQLLNFSEKYKIKKENNTKRISEWRKNQIDKENVTRYESVSNTPKLKESKVNDILIRQSEFKSEIKQFNQYDNELLKSFFMYWSEPTKDKTKMRKDLEKTWDTSRRLLTWFNRSKNDKRN
jgi:hypothetical protein